MYKGSNSALQILMTNLVSIQNVCKLSGILNFYIISSALISHEGCIVYSLRNCH